MTEVLGQSPHFFLLLLSPASCKQICAHQIRHYYGHISFLALANTIACGIVLKNLDHPCSSLSLIWPVSTYRLGDLQAMCKDIRCLQRILDSTIKISISVQNLLGHRSRFLIRFCLLELRSCCERSPMLPSTQGKS